MGDRDGTSTHDQWVWIRFEQHDADEGQARCLPSYSPSAFLRPHTCPFLLPPKLTVWLMKVVQMSTRRQKLAMTWVEGRGGQGWGGEGDLEVRGQGGGGGGNRSLTARHLLQVAGEGGEDWT